MTFAQERLWFLDRLGAGAAYNLPGAVRLVGPLRPAVLRAALAEVVRRHEGLRSRFPEREGRPILEIAPPGVMVSFAPQRLAAAEGARRSEEANETATRQRPIRRARISMPRSTTSGGAAVKQTRT